MQEQISKSVISFFEVKQRLYKSKFGKKKLTQDTPVTVWPLAMHDVWAQEKLLIGCNLQTYGTSKSIKYICVHQFNSYQFTFCSKPNGKDLSACRMHSKLTKKTSSCKS